MEASPLNIKHDDNSEKALKVLFEAFGSTFSLQDITSAYHKADRNADLAGEILYNKQGNTSTFSLFASNGEPMVVESSKRSFGDTCEKSHHKNGKFITSKQKYHPVSGGSVSSIIGKDYVKPTPVANGCIRAKPMKLDAKELLESELWIEKLNPSKNGHMQKDIEDFLFRMLGDGFQLERDVIHQVLDKCGYDLQKSVDELLDLSSVNLHEGDKCLSRCTEKTVDLRSDSDQPSCQKLFPSLSSCGGGVDGISNLNGEIKPPQQEDRDDLQKEVLVALFNAADRSEVSNRRARAARRSRALGELVVEPPRDFTLECNTLPVDLKQDNNNAIDEDEEDAYQQLRRAVKEYRVTMKEYYKAAVIAFTKGDYDRANKLMDEGQFFREKARKADEESRQKMFETKNIDTQDELMLDLHDHGAKEAMRLLKCHLSSLSGIASIKYLKVIIETDEEDASKGARRRLVVKLLEKESIEWTEAGNAGMIIIRLDNINRKGLSFAKR